MIRLVEVKGCGSLQRAESEKYIRGLAYVDSWRIREPARLLALQIRSIPSATGHVACIGGPLTLPRSPADAHSAAASDAAPGRPPRRPKRRRGPPHGLSSRPQAAVRHTPRERPGRVQQAPPSTARAFAAPPPQAPTAAGRYTLPAGQAARPASGLAASARQSADTARRADPGPGVAAQGRPCRRQAGCGRVHAARALRRAPRPGPSHRPAAPRRRPGRRRPGHRRRPRGRSRGQRRGRRRRAPAPAPHARAPRAPHAPARPPCRPPAPPAPPPPRLHGAAPRGQGAALARAPGAPARRTPAARLSRRGPFRVGPRPPRPSGDTAATEK